MTRAHRLVAALILLAYLVLGLACGLVVPPFENLDEIEHLGAIRYVADTGRLPAHGIPAAEEYHYRQEASQPPLYYLLSAGLVRLLGLRADDMDSFWRFNPWVACGPDAANLYDNRAILYHDPNREAFPWHGTLLMLHVLRAWSTLLQVVTVVGAYALGRLAFSRRPAVALLGMAVVAFNPQFLLVASGVNNDNLVTPLATVALYLLLRTWRDGLAVWRSLGLGLLIGLAGLSKLSGWTLLILAGAVLLLLALRSRPRHSPFAIRHWSLLIGHSSLVILPALAVSGWWFWHNWRLYGDLTALRPMLALVGERGSPIYPLLETGLMFRSFWGQISCSFYPAGFYVFYGAFTTLALGGLVWGWRRLERAEKAAAAILAGWFLLIVISWARWDALTPAPGGRLLFPALPAAALVLALGSDGWSASRQSVNLQSAICNLRLVIVHCSLFILLAFVALWTAAGILPGFFAPPPRYADAGAIDPQHPLDATLGDGVRLLGYDVTLEERGPTLDVTLYWQALAPLAEDYALALQLVSPVPGDTTLRWNYNSWPGHGNYPTTAWRPGEVIADRYRFRLPEAGFPTQAWDLHALLFEGESGARLPVRVNGLAVGDHLVLARLRVPAHVPSCPDEGQLTPEVHFESYTTLTHAWVTSDQEGTRVVLCWKALAPLPGDYTVFVHALDGAGALIDTGDGPPMQGAFPTSLWRPGDVILDVHHLTIAESAVQRITVGLYSSTDGSRLPASVGDTPVPDAEVQVWPSGQ
jgi:4-amino-4-deoxy-L-arabinose transferase-like glycosyltransferase